MSVPHIVLLLSDCEVVSNNTPKIKHHTTRQFKVSFTWCYQVMNNSWKFLTKVTISHTTHFWRQNHSVTILAQCFYRGDNWHIHQNNRRDVLRAPECFADCSGLQSAGAYTFSVFSGVYTILTLLPGFLFITEVVVWNFCIQFLMVLLSGTFTCLPVIKCFLNTIELLSLCHYFWKMSWWQTHSQHPTSGTCFY